MNLRDIDPSATVTVWLRDSNDIQQIVTLKASVMRGFVLPSDDIERIEVW